MKNLFFYFRCLNAKLIGFTLVYFFCNQSSFSQDGLRDSTFGNNGISEINVSTFAFGSGDIGEDIVKLPDGKLIIGGWYTAGGGGGNFDWCMVRTDSMGVIDSTFGLNGIVTTEIGDAGTDSRAYSLVYDSLNNKIYLGGYGSISGNLGFAIARYNNDGSIDSTYGNFGIVLDTAIYGSAASIALQSDGKIIACGSTQLGGNNAAVVRYNYNGVRDNTFNSIGINIFNMGYTRNLNSIIFDPYSKRILSVGSSNITNSTNDEDFLIICLDSTGTLDPTFNGIGWKSIDLSSSSNDIGRKITFDKSHQILFTGSANSVFATVRLNPNGSLDNSFNNNGITLSNFSLDFEEAYDISVQQDCKIVIVGNSQIYWFTPSIMTIIRLLPNGAIDSSFGSMGIMRDSVTTFDSGIANAKSVLINNNKIVVAGNSFHINDENLLICQYNSSYDASVVCNTASEVHEFQKESTFELFPNPARNFLNITTSDNFNKKLIVTIFNPIGQNEFESEIINQESNTINIDKLKPGVYIVRIMNSNNIFVSKFIKE